jgi:hypothetical protein
MEQATTPRFKLWLSRIILKTARFVRLRCRSALGCEKNAPTNCARLSPPVTGDEPSGRHRTRSRSRARASPVVEHAPQPIRKAFARRTVS